MARLSISCMGDSLTENNNPYWGSCGVDCWPHVMQTTLRAAGLDVLARSFGVSGETTTQMLARIDQMWRYGVPTIGVIYGGANDPGASISGATTTANIVAMAQALVAKGTNFIVVIGQHYKNWSSGGDTTTTQEATYAGLRTAQQNAVAALVAAGINAIYADMYAIMRGLIVDGTETQGSNCWSAVANNQHLSSKRTRDGVHDGGHDVIGKAVAAAITGNAAMKTALGG